jgi:hypothetical protein
MTKNDDTEDDEDSNAGGRGGRSFSYHLADLRDHGSWIYGCTLMFRSFFGRPGQEKQKYI